MDCGRDLAAAVADDGRQDQTSDGRLCFMTFCKMCGCHNESIAGDGLNGISTEIWATNCTSIRIVLRVETSFDGQCKHPRTSK